MTSVPFHEVELSRIAGRFAKLEVAARIRRSSCEYDYRDARRRCKLQPVMLKALLKRIVPKPLLNLIRYRLEQRSLGKIQTVPADFGHLKIVDPSELNRLFHSEEIAPEWEEVEVTLKGLGLWNPHGGTGGPDLKALYYLVRHYGCSSILEVGTHLGCSTATIACALAKLPDGNSPRMTTVDIVDVNDDVNGPWRDAGVACSPRGALERLDPAFAVEFVQSRSVEYLRNSNEQFDFIFLDGDHAANTVYQEIALVTRLVGPDGIIALHDYSHNRMFQIYYDGWTIPGPFLAARRASRERGDADVIALGKLPGMTGKEESLLAVLGRTRATS